jgi:site-specific DNA-methyltransferase (adenine-specific)
MFTLTKFEAAKQALAEAHSASEVKGIRDKAEALRLYFKRQRDGLIMQNQAAEIKMRAERKAGAILADMEKAKGGGNGNNQYARSNLSPRGTGCIQTLTSLGITRNQSSRWQQVASIPEDLFEQFIQDTIQDGEELTTHGLLEFSSTRAPSPTPREQGHDTSEQLPHYVGIKHGDTLTVLKTFPDESIDCIVTSPPYYGLRDYGTALWQGGKERCKHWISQQQRCLLCGALKVDQQIGLEATLEEYLEKMLLITRELQRVLKKTGTMFWNHGDSYASYGNEKSRCAPDGNISRKEHGRCRTNDVPAKSLLLQAHRLAIRMIDEQGWILRNICIWHKPNCMPSSVKDRFSVNYEPVFFFTKSETYFFEQQYEPHQEVSIKRAAYGWRRGKEYPPEANVPENVERMGERFVNPLGRNKRCVWTIPTKAFGDAHFAVYPEELCAIPIKAGCPEYICTKCRKPREKIMQDMGERTWKDTRQDTSLTQGTRGLSFGRLPQIAMRGYIDCGCHAPWRPGMVLDPFFGSGTTAIAAHALRRSWVGIELSEEYIRIAKKRLVEHGIYPESQERIVFRSA